MKKIRKKNKGFTLTELLVTIAVVTLVTTIAVVSIQQIIKLSEKNKNDISITSIKKSASQYTEEFKTSDIYWFRYADTTNENEYACTTVGMLINKGYLKKDILGIEIEEKIDGELKKITISEDTSIKVERNKNTKVYNLEQIYEFNTIECGESADIDLNFAVKGNNTNCDSYATLDECPYKDWYNQNVTIEIMATNPGQINGVNYTVNIDGSGEKSIEELSVNNEKTSDWNIVIGEQGKNIDACVTIIDRKDNSKKYCLSHDGLIYNMDKEAPQNILLNLEKNNVLKLVSKDASDNVTEEIELKYIISNNNIDLKYGIGSVEFINTIDEQIVPPDNGSYTISVTDLAGNTTVETMVLSSKKSINGNVTGGYACILENNEEIIYYSTKEEAMEKCNITEFGVVSGKTVYICELNSTEYLTKEEAITNCYETGTIQTKYCCSSSDCSTSSSYICGEDYYRTYRYILTYSLICTDNGYVTWNGSEVTSGDSTHEGCPDDYTTYSYSGNCGTYFGGGGNWTKKTPCEKGWTGSCNQERYGGCKKSGYSASATYVCSVTGETCSSSNCDCKKAGTVSDGSKYGCSLFDDVIYKTSEEAQASCSKITPGNIKDDMEYLCDLTNEVYSNEEDASNDCTNYCDVGTIEYDDYCYNLG